MVCHNEFRRSYEFEAVVAKCAVWAHIYHLSDPRLTCSSSLALRAVNLDLDSHVGDIDVG